MNYWKKRYDRLLDHLKNEFGASYVLKILFYLEEQEEQAEGDNEAMVEEKFSEEPKFEDK